MRSASALVTAAMLTAGLALVFAPGAALALDPCPKLPSKTVVARGLGVLESIVGDHDGRIIFSESPAEGSGRLLALNRRGGTPYTVVDGVDEPGGLILKGKHKVLAGFGNSLAGLTGNLFPQAGLYLADLRTGEKEVYVDGLMMANGVTRGPDGTIYATNDFGIGIDRIVGRTVTNRWSPVVSGNGLEVDHRNEWLYVNTTFRPAQIERVKISDPATIQTFYTAEPLSLHGGLDGMAIDEHDNLYVAVNLFGEVWKVDPSGHACLLADGVARASDLAFGKTRRKGRLHRGNLYVTGFEGTVTELRGVRPRVRRRR